MLAENLCFAVFTLRCGLRLLFLCPLRAVPPIQSNIVAGLNVPVNFTKQFYKRQSIDAAVVFYGAGGGKSPCDAVFDYFPVYGFYYEVARSGFDGADDGFFAFVS